MPEIKVRKEHWNTETSKREEELLSLNINVNHTDSQIEMAKRTHLPLKLTFTCPSCKTDGVMDLGDCNYLMYPCTNAKDNYVVHCDNCEDEFRFTYKLKFDMELFDFEPREDDD